MKFGVGTLGASTLSDFGGDPASEKSGVDAASLIMFERAVARRSGRWEALADVAGPAVKLVFTERRGNGADMDIIGATGSSSSLSEITIASSSLLPPTTGVLEGNF